MNKTKIVDPSFWVGKKVFLTGHTGFKGSWLSLWLHLLGAEVTGYALEAPTTHSLFELGKIETFMKKSIYGDVSDLELLTQSMVQAEPDIVIHMAAQPLVRASYVKPVDTFQTNVMGTVHVLEATRSCSSVRAILNVTTDKCYENQEWSWGYREIDHLGGYDPYSSSKACSELITSAYRRSFLEGSNIRVATARAGNVIGGGDWAEDRLIPDLIRSLTNEKKIHIRHPGAMRPWQHVLEPLSGYLVLCQSLYHNEEDYSGAWNFGPLDSDVRSVEWIVQKMLNKWSGHHPGYEIDSQKHVHEATMLKLDCSKAHTQLGWYPQWRLEKALDLTIQWVHDFKAGRDVKEICIQQINEYMNEEHMNS